MRLEKISNNLYVFITEELSVYFSYETPIAFEHEGELYISENVWTNTTGKHLNMIDSDKKNRMPNVLFEGNLKHITKEFGLCN